MISCAMNAQIPFTTAFVVTTFSSMLDQSHKFEQSYEYQYVSDLFITDRPIEQNVKSGQMFSLNETLFLCISRSKNKLPISKISNTLETIQGWQQIQKLVKVQDMRIPTLSIQRSKPKIGINIVSSIQVLEQSKVNKNLLQNSQQDELSNNQEVQILELFVDTKKVFIFIHKKPFNAFEDYDKINLKLTPQTSLLYSISDDQIETKSFSSLCFPNGIELFRKQGGFKTFNLTLLNSRVERIYCNALQFREKCSPQIKKQLIQKYSLEDIDTIYAQKTITMVSRYSCTDQITHCLQHLYRIYLSQGQMYFNNQVKHLSSNFTINQKTNKAYFRSKGFDICFKVNTSFPQTSINAIYAVFKFLQIEKIVFIFQSILLESKIFFISDCQNILGYMIEAFQSFIYPLIWVHSIIPQLTQEIVDHIEAPMPVIFGLSSELAESALDENTRQKTQGVYVYVDRNQVQSNVKNQKKLRTNLRQLLIKRLTQFTVYDRYDVRDYLSNTQNMGMFKTQKQEDPNFNPYKIRNIFFELLVFLLKDYRLYFVQESKRQNINTHLNMKKNYDLALLLAHSRRQKDTFLVQLFNTTLFAQLIDTKLNEPKNKWIKTLDKAIKKIKQYQKQFIRQQSDTQSDYNDDQEHNIQIPRGCLNLIHLFSKQSDDRQKSNTSSPRKSQSPPISSIADRQRKSLQSTKPSQQSNNSDTLQYDRKDSLSTNPKNSLSNSDGIPELNQDNHEKVIYTYDVNDPQQQQQNSGFCFYFSYPYRKVKKSTAAQWTKSQVLKLRIWLVDKHNKQAKQQEKVQKIFHDLKIKQDEQKPSKPINKNISNKTN